MHSAKKKKKPCSSDLGMNMYLCAKFQGVSLRQKRREHQVLVLKTRVLYVVACDHLVLVSVSYTHLTLPTIYSV